MICICIKTNRWFRLSMEVFFFGVILSHRRLQTTARRFFRNGWSKLSWASAYQRIPWTCGWYFWISIASIPTADSAGIWCFFAYRAMCFWFSNCGRTRKICIVMVSSHHCSYIIMHTTQYTTILVTICCLYINDSVQSIHTIIILDYQH